MLFDQQTVTKCHQLVDEIAAAYNHSDRQLFMAKCTELEQLLVSGTAPLHQAGAEIEVLLANMRQNQLWELNSGVFEDKSNWVAELRSKYELCILFLFICRLDEAIIAVHAWLGVVGQIRWHLFSGGVHLQQFPGIDQIQSALTQLMRAFMQK